MAVRTFFAVDIDQCIRDRLGEVVRLVEAPRSKIRWVADDQIHVTLKFLGDVADEVINDVCATAEEVASRIEPFEFHVRGLLCQPPSGRQLRMIWAGVEDPTSGLSRMHDELDAALAGLGLRRDNRAFKPHLTLARIKYADQAEAVRRAAAGYAAKDFGTQYAKGLVAYSSQLTPTGPVYAPIAGAKLGR